MDNAAEHYRKVETDLYIETVKGNKFFFNRPTFDIEEIAHATAMQCRYTGHVREFYSVAEHSVMVAELMRLLDLGDPKEGLLHDATEAYLSDIAAPWKVLLPDYKKIEGSLDEKMRAHFHLPRKITDGCKRADWIALFIESHYLMPSKAADWPAPDGVKKDAAGLIATLSWEPRCWGPRDARKAFMRAYAIA